MSRADALVALTVSPADGGVSLCAPAVGVLRDVPEPGRVLGSGTRFASLIVLGCTHPLLVPEGVTGVVAALEVDGFGNDTIPVEYAQPILTLAPIEGVSFDAAGGPSAGVGSAAPPPGSSVLPDGIGRSGAAAATAGAAGARRGSGASRGAAGPALEAAGGATSAAGTRGLGLPEGCHAVVCPADGVFYRRPRPTDDAYVEVGSAVRTGQTLGLIEAMKTFSPIPYGGPGLPSPATVIEIRAGDSQEVRHGQVLFVVR